MVDKDQQQGAPRPVENRSLISYAWVYKSTDVFVYPYVGLSWKNLPMGDSLPRLIQSGR